MNQNRSSAVMQQRVEPADLLDDFPTPPYGTRAPIEKIIRPRGIDLGTTAWEPCCNRGYMARPLREYYPKVHATDVFDYGWSGMDQLEDFLFPGLRAPYPIDWVWANPPFVAAEQFIDVALRIARIGCAMFVRTSFLESQDRYEKIFSVRPPTIIAQFVERIILTKGIVRDPSKPYWDPEAIDKKTGQKGAWKRPSTATSYCWLFWVHGMERQPFDWIPPCRRELTRPGDYAT